MPKILIIEATFYQDIGTKLSKAAISELEASGYSYNHIKVPGCFEIPAALAMAIEQNPHDGYIALGCVIKGETSHYDYVCMESARGLNEIAINKQIALGYGIITAFNVPQVFERSSNDDNNVGKRAAIACIQMIEIKNKLKNL